MSYQYMPKIFHDPHKNPAPPPPLLCSFLMLFDWIVVKTCIPKQLFFFFSCSMVLEGFKYLLW